MARVSGKSTDIYIDQYQMDTYASSYTFTIDNPLTDVTTFGDSANTFVSGKPVASFSMNAFFSPTSNESDTILDGELTGGQEVIIVPEGLTIGNMAHEFGANLNNRTIDNPVDGATALNVTAQGTESLRRSAVLYTPGSTALSSTGAVTSSRVDTGSSSFIGSLSSGTVKRATLRVTAVSGSGTATIKIQDSSSSGSGYGDFVAFAQISGVGTQTVTTTDACERYLQINVTQYSGFTNFNCMVTMGVDLGT